jgi:hypothetical protein
VQLVLPETGVCSVDLALTDDAGAQDGGCGTSTCGTPAAEPSVDPAHAAWANGEPRLGFATGAGGGRVADAERAALPVTDVSASAGGSCCG